MGRVLAAAGCCWSCGLLAFAAAPPIGQPDEFLAARRWVAARFEGVEPTAELETGLLVRSNYGTVQQNARGSRPLQLAGASYRRGLYCHAPSRLTVRLPAPAATFSAVVGIDSNEQTRSGQGSVVFVVRRGDQELWRSGVLREGMAGVPVQLDVAGADELELVVEDASDGISCDQADWADVRVTLADGRDLWLGELPLQDDTHTPTTLAPPFSFRYGDSSFLESFDQWQVERSSVRRDAHRVDHHLAYTDPRTGLVARCEAVVYDDFPTVEWTVYFQNNGTQDTPVLADLQPLDVTWRRAPGNEFSLHHLRGDSCTPDSYEPLLTVLPASSQTTFAPSGGRPTNGAWPYWNVAWGRGGVLMALGWPGQWSVRFARDGGDLLRVQGGQELTHFVLRPGEEARTPLVVLQFYAGDWMRAQNVWRRWMLAHNLPRCDGQLPQPFLSSCSGGFFPGLKCNADDEIRFIDTYAREGIRLDYWWMDAGWYPCDAWPQVGTWVVDRTRFPGGLQAISRHVHAHQAQLILWFEPERVAPGTWLYEQRPQWLLGPDGGHKLLNLGDPAARQWLIDHIDALITQEGIDLYRQDFNIDPLPFWRAADPPDRQGMTEMRHVEGYLAYWDELRRRHPGMLIDSCASGGRRNDLETLRRAVPLLRSDYQSFAGDSRYALGNQCHTYGLSLWIPFYGQGVYDSDDEPTYSVRSHFCPALGYCTDVRRERIDWNRMRRLVDDWRQVAPTLLGDFYPLTPYTLADDDWIGWQFDCPAAGIGSIQVFRRPDSVYTSARLRLQGLDPEATYELINLDVPGSTRATGATLTAAGLAVTIDSRPGATIITYRKQSDAPPATSGSR